MKSLIPASAVLSCSLAAFLAVTAASAQAPVIPAAIPATAPATPAAPAIAVTASYRLAPADVISISALPAAANLSVSQAVVAPDGTVSLPLLDAVSVTGQTPEEIAQMLTKRWRKFVVRPVVSVSLIQKHPESVVFSGWLTHPGALPYRPGLHLIEALAEAGGPVPDASNPSQATLTHEDGSKQTVDLTQPETKAGTEMDVALAPGDVVYVPQQLAKVSVVGQVKQPGSMPWNDHLTVLEAIGGAGGVDMETADLPAATLTHNGKDAKIDLNGLLRKGDMSSNIKLSPGDFLTIPELHNRTYVFGSVGRPGFYYFKPGDRILDALNGAGGNTREADLSKVNLIHTDDAKNISQMARVNLNEFLLHGNISGNPYISPGDSLYIPDKHHQFSLDDVTKILGGVGSIAITDRTLKGR